MILLSTSCDDVRCAGAETVAVLCEEVVTLWEALVLLEQLIIGKHRAP